MRGRRPGAASILMLTPLFIAGCRGGGEGRLGEPLRVAAAASLQAPLGELAEAYRKRTSGPQIAVTYAASSTLRLQIAEGAPYDLFVSADLDQPAKLHEQGDALPPKVFAFNRLVFAAPAGGRIVEFSRLPPGRYGGVAPDVPLGRYTEQMLQCLRTGPGVRAVETFRDNIVTREPNAGALRTRLELRELDGAFLYATDIQSSTRLRGLELPEQCERPLPYAAAVIARSRHRSDAEAFARYLLSEPAAVILKRHGFRRAPATALSDPAGLGIGP